MDGFWAALRAWLDGANAMLGPWAERIDMARNAPIAVVGLFILGILLWVVGRVRAAMKERAADRRLAAIEETAGQAAEDAAVVRRTLVELSERQRQEFEKLKTELLRAQAASGVVAAVPDEEWVGALTGLVAAHEPAKQDARAKAERGEVAEAADDLFAFARRQAGAAKEAKTEMDRRAAETFRQAGALASATNVAKAVEAYREAARLEPNDFWTQVTLRRLAAEANDYAAADAAVEAMAGAAADERERLVALNERADMKRLRGDLSGSAALQNESLEIARRRAEADPADFPAAIDYAVGLSRAAVAHKEAGDLGAAARDFDAARAIDDRVLTEDPNNIDALVGLVINHSALCELARTRSDLDAALYHVKGAVGFARIAQKYVGDAGAADRLAAALRVAGEAQSAKGQIDDARASFDEALAINRDWVARDPTNAFRRHELAVSLSRFGDFLVARKDFAAARAAFEEMEAITGALAAEDPSNPMRHSDHAAALEHLGVALQAEGDAAAAITRYEAAAAAHRRLLDEPNLAGAARAHLAVCLGRAGDLAFAREDYAGALPVREEVLDLRRALRDAAPDDEFAARAYEVALGHVGETVHAAGDVERAIPIFEEALPLARRAAAAEPANFDWVRDVTVALWRLAVVGRVPWSQVVASYKERQAAGLFDEAMEAAHLDEAERLAAEAAE